MLCPKSTRKTHNIEDVKIIGGAGKMAHISLIGIAAINYKEVVGYDTHT